MFVMACQEMFAVQGGETWMVGHFLFEKTSQDGSCPTQHWSNRALERNAEAEGHRATPVGTCAVRLAGH